MAPITALFPSKTARPSSGPQPAAPSSEPEHINTEAATDLRELAAKEATALLTDELGRQADQWCRTLDSVKDALSEHLDRAREAAASNHRSDQALAVSRL